MQPTTSKVDLSLPLCDECEEADAALGCGACAIDDNNATLQEKPLCRDCSATLHAVKKRRHHTLRALELGAAPIPPKEQVGHAAATGKQQGGNPSTSSSSVKPQDASPASFQAHASIGDMEELDVHVSKQSDGGLGFDVTYADEGYLLVNRLGETKDHVLVGDVIVAVQDKLVRELSANQVEHLLHRHLVLRLQVLRGHGPPEALFAAWTQLVDARRVTQDEGTKEIISLQQVPSGHFHLRTNDANVDSMFEAAALSEAKVPVISFLGNTTAGKSFLIRSLMADREVRPFCFDEEKMCSTTANANMYASTHVVTDTRVNVIDFEGENGLTPFMNMIRRTKHLFHSAKDETKQRHIAVETYFPKIAYLLSDVIVLVGDTSLVNKDYFTRCRDFAMKANVGVSETMCRPSLLIVHNKCSLTANFDVAATTREFMQAHIYDEYDVVLEQAIGFGFAPSSDDGDADNQVEGSSFCAVTHVADAAARGSKIHVGDLVVALNGASLEGQSAADVLEAIETAVKPCSVRFRSAHTLNSEAMGFLDYFADVHCVRVPRGDIRQNIRGKWYNGDEILAQQLATIHHLLGDMVAKQNDMRRDISVGERGWFFLLRSIVAQVAAGKPVSFGSLLNELLSTGDGDVDRITSMFVRVYETQPVRHVDWFCQCLHFSIDVFARMIAFNMRRKAHISLLTRETVRSTHSKKCCCVVAAQAKKSLQLLLTSLQRFLPCAGVYPGAPQFVCGQHRMFHANQRGAHRTSERVPRSGPAWKQWLSELDGGCHMVWEGSFEAPPLPPTFFDLGVWDEAFLEDIHRYLFDESDKNVALKMDELLYELLAKHTAALHLEFKVLSDNTLTHVPCLRCFKGCDAKDAAAAVSMKERLLQWHTHIELIYLAPHHLGVCSGCKKYFGDIGLLSQ
ncbi:Aste57867_18113 [Aphanomyces stellatus]|uniref:Aste57867_18113 protein n=1 Tax=Aphanomyces stellatus TaxID=120398 RepID=A0A485L972_9STRA|nr:hypothetical protein As57867_018051 [Aphanomyces stellatus]VFT94851.1 Aste57867_18113 [Aphanomyces stellatus]